MGAPRYLVGFVCAGLIAGCAEGTSSEVDANDLNLGYETANLELPPAPEGATCVLIQRGTLGQVQDTDIGYGNGPDWAAGAYPFTWTGPSPYNHVSLYKFDLSPVPPASTIVLGVFTNYVAWNEESSTVRIHRLIQGWDEATSTWSNFTNNGAVTGWDPDVLATFDPYGVGYVSTDITGLVKSWYSGAVVNHGIVLEEDPVKLHTYFASEASTVDMRPSLYVCYVAGVDQDPDPGVECTPAGGGCGDNEDCCDGLSCIGGECGVPPSEEVCSQDNAPCSLNTPCCNPNAVCDGVCIPLPPIDDGGDGGDPAPMCAADNAPCSLNTPCCNANSVCDGVCFPMQPGGGGDDGGGDACFPIAAECGDNELCCTGSCLDGVCTALNVPGTCLQPDSIEACSPDSPCCAGSHCVLGLCFPDDSLYGGTCSLPGNPCDPDELGQWCCWDQQCVNGTCQ